MNFSSCWFFFFFFFFGGGGKRCHPNIFIGATAPPPPDRRLCNEFESALNKKVFILVERRAESLSHDYQHPVIVWTWSEMPLVLSFGSLKARSLRQIKVHFNYYLDFEVLRTRGLDWPKFTWLRETRLCANFQKYPIIIYSSEQRSQSDERKDYCGTIACSCQPVERVVLLFRVSRTFNVLFSPPPPLSDFFLFRAGAKKKKKKNMLLDRPWKWKYWGRGIKTRCGLWFRLLEKQ